MSILPIFGLKHQGMYRKFLLAVLWAMIGAGVQAQLSQGGSPLEISYLKSAPIADELRLSLPMEAKADETPVSLTGKQIKPFRFAHAIPVCLDLSNSGFWCEHGGYRVWQLTLYSPGAKSLNLIFDRFHVPEGARLFLFSPNRDDILGAFTSANHKPDGKLATAPVIGDRLVIQYEEPVDADFPGDLSVKAVNHDFVGIKAAGNERRPLGESGYCQVNVNCDFVDAYRQSANSVCRVLVKGTELCTGTLLNNTRKDGTPYIYTAAHCIKNNAEASETVFLFNYESPYCGNIDGEVNHTLSGSMLRAESDSLDFSLVELSVAPPKSYRPYYLGWNHQEGIPDSTACIHHPLGDIKKIAIDGDAPTISTYSEDYIHHGFFLVGDWERGTTESGSSGAPLIDGQLRMVGSLTGGAATCENPQHDYFARLNMAWDYYPEASRQLKAWLDPQQNGTGNLDGYSPFEGNDLCLVVTHFTDEDEHENLLIDESDESMGYWAGSNAYGFTAFAEQFRFQSGCQLSGIVLGVARAVVDSHNPNARFSVDVYNGDEKPENLLYSQGYYLHDLDEGVMNELSFHEPVQTNGKFFVGISIDELTTADTLSVFLAQRMVDPKNTFFIKDGNEWYAYPEKSGTTEGSAMLMEAVVCGLDSTDLEPDLKDLSLAAKAFPNPFGAGQRLLVQFKEPVQVSRVDVFDLLGHQVNVSYTRPGDRWLYFDFAGRRAGIYFIRVQGDNPVRDYRLRVVYLGGA